MRESEQYNRYLTKEETTRLAVKYHMMHTHLGEQVGADYRGYCGYPCSFVIIADPRF